MAGQETMAWESEKARYGRQADQTSEAKTEAVAVAAYQIEITNRPRLSASIRSSTHSSSER